jgi:DnaK suppressor protein
MRGRRPGPGREPGPSDQVLRMSIVNGCDHPAAGVHPAQAPLAASDDVRRRLEEELGDTAERLRRIDSASTADAEPFVQRQTALDVIDEVQANETREALFASRERLLTRIERLRAALARLEAGSYGRCLECGASIGAARLRALPDATTCVACQGRHEQAVSLARPSPYRSFESVEAGALLAEATAAPPEATLPSDDAARLNTPGTPLTARDNRPQPLNSARGAIRIPRHRQGGQSRRRERPDRPGADGRPRRRGPRGGAVPATPAADERPGRR